MPSDNSNERTRRNVLRKVAGASAGAAAVPGLAAAGESSEATASVQGQSAERLDGDVTVLDVTGNSAIEGPPLSTDCRDNFGESVQPWGVEFTFQGYFGCCEANLEIEALGQSVTFDFQDCNTVCHSRSQDFGAVQADFEVCYDNDAKELEIEIHAKIWRVTGWYEDTKTFTIT